MKKSLILIALVSVLSIPANAQVLSKLGIFNHVGVSVGAGTTGINVDVATPITAWAQLRAGVDIMPAATFKTDVDAEFDISSSGYTGTADVEYNAKGSLKRTQGHVLLNFYPFRNVVGLFISAGGYFGGADVITITGNPADQSQWDMVKPYINTTNGGILVGDYVIPADPNTGYVKGSLRAPSFRPYLGIGWGKPCPKNRVSFMFDLGVQFGKMKVCDSKGKEVNINPNGDDDNDFKKVMDKLTVYPVLKFSLNGRIF